MKHGPRPVYARIRIETLESHIGRVIAKGDDTAAAALRYFARSSGIDLDDGNICTQTELYRKELARWRSQS